MEVAKSDRVGQINRTVVLKLWAGRYPQWTLGGGAALDIYTVDIAILTIVCYMYTGKKMYGQPIMHFHNKINFISLFNNNNKKTSLFSFSGSLFLHW